MRELHIVAASIALVAGFLALYASKGGWLHRRAGRVFSYAMFAMTAAAVLMSIFEKPNRINAMVGALTFYFVATGLLTVIRRVQDARRSYAVLAALGTLIATAGWSFGLAATGRAGGMFDQYPAGIIFMFAAFGTLGVIGDWRVLHAGAIDGARRLHRHLWRMGYAMWIATSSFFLGQAKFLPAWFKDAHLNTAIVLLVAATVLFWLLRTRLRRAPGVGRIAAGVARENVAS
jgi:uncharacterized membrane protein